MTAVLTPRRGSSLSARAARSIRSSTSRVDNLRLMFCSIGWGRRNRNRVLTYTLYEMSEVIETPPPPPPPPPAPGPPPGSEPPKTTFDFVKPFAFVFEDARWINKVLIGGIFQLLAMMLIGVPFLLGYLAKLVRNVIADVALPLPEWDDLGEMFNEGLRLVGVAILYALPFIMLICMVMLPV